MKRSFEGDKMSSPFLSSYYWAAKTILSQQALLVELLGVEL